MRRLLPHRIRKAMELIEVADGTPLAGTVEADETYIGGKYDARRKRARWDKEPVFGMVERGGKAKTYHIPQINRQNAVAKIKDNISIEADLVCTDDSSIYHQMPANVKRHESVNHSAKEWVRGDVHTGTIDGYWGLLKRGIIGSYHQVSIKHLGRYLSEFQFSLNGITGSDIFTLVIAALVIGSALPYQKLIEALPGETATGAEIPIPLDEEALEAATTNPAQCAAIIVYSNRNAFEGIDTPPEGPVWRAIPGWCQEPIYNEWF